MYMTCTTIYIYIYNCIHVNTNIVIYIYIYNYTSPACWSTFWTAAAASLASLSYIMLLHPIYIYIYIGYDT